MRRPTLSLLLLSGTALKSGIVGIDFSSLEGDPITSPSVEFMCVWNDEKLLISQMLCGGKAISHEFSVIFLNGFVFVGIETSIGHLNSEGRSPTDVIVPEALPCSLLFHCESNSQT